LGKFMLDGIPPAPRGVPQVEVTFDLDANGILKVTAKDKATGKSQDITITASSALSKEEIDRMQKEAQAHAEDDRKKKEMIELRNQADSTVYQTEKTIKEFGDKVPADIKKQIEEKLAAVKSTKDGSDTAALKKALDELSDVVQKIGSELYKNQPPTPPPAGSGPTEPKKDDGGVVEGEIVDEKK
jgi:molecular chaperone DnaK